MSGGAPAIEDLIVVAEIDRPQGLRGEVIATIGS